jgi:hypothetical protein
VTTYLWLVQDDGSEPEADEIPDDDDTEVEADDDHDFEAERERRAWPA